jgi:hypothetical protein
MERIKTDHPNLLGPDGSGDNAGWTLRRGGGRHGSDRRAGGRDGFCGECYDVLPNFIFLDLKIRWPQSVDRMALLVRYGHRNEHLSYIQPDHGLISSGGGRLLLSPDSSRKDEYNG